MKRLTTGIFAVIFVMSFLSLAVGRGADKLPHGYVLARNWGSTGSDTLTTLTNDLGATKSWTVIIDGVGPWAISNNISFNTNLVVYVMPDTYFSINTNCTVTVNSAWTDTTGLKFSGDGVANGDASMIIERSEWYGGDSDFDIGTAIMSAQWTSDGTNAWLTDNENILIFDDNFIGFSSTSGRMVWDDQSTDELVFKNLHIGIDSDNPNVPLAVRGTNTAANNVVFQTENNAGELVGRFRDVSGDSVMDLTKQNLSIGVYLSAENDSYFDGTGVGFGGQTDPDTAVDILGVLTIRTNATPTTPDVDSIGIFMDAADDILKYIDSNGTVSDFGTWTNMNNTTNYLLGFPALTLTTGMLSQVWQDASEVFSLGTFTNAFDGVTNTYTSIGGLLVADDDGTVRMDLGGQYRGVYRILAEVKHITGANFSGYRSVVTKEHYGYNGTYNTIPDQADNRRSTDDGTWIVMEDIQTFEGRNIYFHFNNDGADSTSSNRFSIIEVYANQIE